MATQSTSDFAEQVFTYLMRRINPHFSFPGGAAAHRCVEKCLNTLKERYFCLSRERIVDFVICQVQALSRFGEDYLCRWRVNHSFGCKAQERYARQTDAMRYYQDRWLKELGLTRGMLYAHFEDHVRHPLQKFVYPEYEDATKRRLLGLEAGFYICLVSTLLWTPFSPVCCACVFAERCRILTQRKYHELYRLRVSQAAGRRMYADE